MKRLTVLLFCVVAFAAGHAITKAYYTSTLYILTTCVRVVQPPQTTNGDWL